MLKQKQMGWISQGDSQNLERKAQLRAKMLKIANSERVLDKTVILNNWILHLDPEPSSIAKQQAAYLNRLSANVEA